MRRLLSRRLTITIMGNVLRAKYANLHPNPTEEKL